MTSAIGESANVAPTARIASAVSRHLRSRSGASHDDATQICCGYVVAVRAARPEITSSWQMAGMCDVVSVRQNSCTSRTNCASDSGSSVRLQANWQMWPMPCGMCARAFAAEKRPSEPVRLPAVVAQISATRSSGVNRAYVASTRACRSARADAASTAQPSERKRKQFFMRIVYHIRLKCAAPFGVKGRGFRPSRFFLHRLSRSPRESRRHHSCRRAFSTSRWPSARALARSVAKCASR